MHRKLKGEIIFVLLTINLLQERLDLAEVYYGLSLQMMTYLDVALEHADELLGFHADPAGLLYMHVHNPMIRPGAELIASTFRSMKLRNHIKCVVILLEHPEVVEAMDSDIGQFFIDYSSGI